MRNHEANENSTQMQVTSLRPKRHPVCSEKNMNVTFLGQKKKKKCYMTEHGQNNLGMHLRHGKFEIFYIIGF